MLYVHHTRCQCPVLHSLHAQELRHPRGELGAILAEACRERERACWNDMLSGTIITLLASPVTR